jgi:hypothetical protein
LSVYCCHGQRPIFNNLFFGFEYLTVRLHGVSIHCLDTMRLVPLCVTLWKWSLRKSLRGLNTASVIVDLLVCQPFCHQVKNARGRELLIQLLHSEYC